MNTSEHIMNILKRHVDTIFYVSGGGICFLTDALGRSGINHIPMICESGVSSAGVGYAMARNGLGVILVTTGPAITNAMTGIASAWTDSVPLLVIGGQARSDTLINGTNLRTRGIQELNGIAITTPVTKCSIQAKSGLHALNSLKSLINLAMEGRKGPVHLEIPLDVQAQEFEYIYE
jgi:acetolactate synthase I/II/III large subunit